MEPPRRPYHHGNLREALLEAAERAVEAAGAGSLTLRELSRGLGVSHTSPRRHFADKQALLDALAQRGFERLGAVLARAARNRGQGFDRRLTQLARAHVRFALKHPSLFGLMLEAKHHSNPPAALLEASERALSIASDIFTAGQRQGEVIPGDPERIGLVAYAAMQGLIAISTNGEFKRFPSVPWSTRSSNASSLGYVLVVEPTPAGVERPDAPRRARSVGSQVRTLVSRVELTLSTRQDFLV